MDLIYLVIALAIIGAVVYLVTTLLPMTPYWARVIQVVALIVILLYLLRRFVPLPNVL
jgi:membrane protein implicated in regulation of membrane protease activity